MSIRGRDSNQVAVNRTGTQGNLILIYCLALPLMAAGCAPLYLSRPGGRGTVLVRVALSHNLASAVIAGTDTVRIHDSVHETTLAPGKTWTVSTDGGTLSAATAHGTVVSQIAGALKAWSRNGVLVNGRRIIAPVELRPEKSGGMSITTELPLEDYLAAVVSAELGMVKPDEIEAAKAQAIAARSYAYAKIGSKPGSGYDLEATVSDQAFSPDKPVSPVILKAVHATEGQVLVCEGKVIAANYHSCCGGRTAPASEVWSANGGELPYIKPVSDAYCKDSPKFKWADTIPANSIAAKLFGSGIALRDIIIAARGRSGRITELKISSAAGDTTLFKDKVRFNLTGHNLPSTKFDLACLRDEAGNVSAVVLQGSGYGHGVGLCQWGAVGMARSGKSCRTILRRFYRNIRIEQIY